MKSLLALTLLAACGAATDRADATTTPPTFLELAGAPRIVPHFRDSVVLIVDAQHEYAAAGRVPLAGLPAALRQTQRLLARARAAHVPVIHIQQISPPARRVFQADTPAIAFAAEAAPAAGETVIVKTLPNAFAGTTLDATLRSLGRQEIIVSGYMTHVCVSATARSALDHGCHATVIADACATRDLPDGAGGTIDAATVHRTALAELADRFATVVPTLDAIPD